VGSLDKRIEALEQRLGGRGPVRIVVVQEGPKGREDEEEPIYSFTLSLSEDEDHPLEEAPEQGDRWGA
jgi:hypothetical protein